MMMMMMVMMMMMITVAVKNNVLCREQTASHGLRR